ncbi:MAG: hypothetical protein L0H64_13170 [Pseudonocardia sp.]|nr:hypothetical protein [Pseudonocardia sp.]
MSTPPTQTPRFFVRQQITMMVNRYRILAVGPDGTDGPLLAFAEQKRFTLKEEVVFFSDEARTGPVFSFKARQRLDVHAEHDVLDADGRPIGSFAKEFGASLLRSTWTLRTPGLDARGQERRPLIAVLRRVWSLIPYLGDVWVPFVFHFDFVDTTTGAPVLSSERQKSIRDRYDVTVHDPRLDFRVAASMAVALDALQRR